MSTTPFVQPDSQTGTVSYRALLDSFRPTRATVSRVSAASLEALSSQGETGARVQPVLRNLQTMGLSVPVLLADSPEGAALRAQHGVATVYRRDASPYAESPGTVMGYAMGVGADDLVLFLHDTAGLSNVQVPHDPLPRVAFTELMIGLVASLPTLDTVSVNEWSRLVRDELEGQRLFQAMRLHQVRLVVGEEYVDLLSDSGRLTAGIQGGTAAGDRIRTRKRTTAGVLNALHSAGAGHQEPAWPYAVGLMPLGYGVVTDPDGRVMTHMGQGEQRWKLIAPAPAEVEPLRQVLRLVAAGRTWRECAEPLVAAKVSARGQKTSRKTYADMSPASRAASVTNLVQEHLNLWMTGRYIRSKNVPAANDGTFEGFPVTPVPGTYGIIEIDIDLGLPDGGFLDATTYTQIRKRLDEREPKVSRVGTCSLLAHLKSYRDSEDSSFTWERRLTRLGDGYVLRERPAAHAINSRGKARGWKAGEGAQILTVRRLDLERSIADAVADAVMEVADRRLVVHIRDAGPNDQASRLDARIHDLECDAQAAHRVGEAADLLAGLAVKGAVRDEDAAARHLNAASQHFAQEARLRQRINELQTQLTSVRKTGEETAFADLSSPAAFAGCLSGFAGHDVPTEINKVLREMGLNSLRLEADSSNSRRIVWTLELDLPLEGGAVATIPVSGSVRNRRRDQDTRASEREVDAAITKEFLAEGRSIDGIGTSFGKDRKRVVTSLRRHLSRHGITKRGLRGAIVDLPVELSETRLALWSIVSGNDETSQHLHAFREYLRAVYTGDLDHPNAWVRTDTTLVRKALSAMTCAVDSGRDYLTTDELARAIGATRSQVNTLCGDRAQTGSTKARFRGVLVRDKRNPSILRMRQCPHPDCAAAKGHRWLSHYLPTPETDGYHGLICPACYRIPDLELGQLYLPASYFELWNGPKNAARYDLGTGPATTISRKEDYQSAALLPPTERVYGVDEAAEYLGITTRALRGWISDDKDPLPARRLSGRGGMKYGITQEVLDAAAQDPRLPATRERSPRPTPLKSEVMTLAELGALVSIPEHYLRRYALAGNLGPIEHRNLAGTGQAHLVVSRDVVHPDDPEMGTELLPAEWIQRHRTGLLLMRAATERTGQSASTIRDAVRRRELPSHVTDGGTHRFALAELDAWADPLRDLLTPAAAAARAGVSTDTLRTAAKRGELKSIPTSGGHARYRAPDVDCWAATRVNGL